MKMHPLKWIPLIGLCFLMGILPMILGCSTPARKQSVQTSGFLNNYSELREGAAGEALRVYVDREVNFHLYDKVMLDPVSIIFSDDSNMAKLPARDRQQLADYFYGVLEKHLSDRYIITSRPGSLTMRLRFALTDIKGSQVLMNTVSHANPIDASVDLISSATTGIQTYIGDANAEMEILDSMTGRRLAAAVDAHSCVWNDVKDACDDWAQRVALRLEEFTSGNYSPKRKMKN